MDKHPFDRSVRRVSRWLAYLAVAALICLMLVTFLDVVLRYFFNSPISGAVEIVYLLMGLLVFLGLSLVTYERGHIQVDVITNLLPSTARRVVDVVVAILSCGTAALIAWRLIVVAGDRVVDRDVTMVFELPIWAVAIVAAVCSCIVVAAMWLQVMEAVREVSASSHKGKD